MPNPGILNTKKTNLVLVHSTSKVCLGSFTPSRMSVAKQNWHHWKHYGWHRGSQFGVFSSSYYIWVLCLPSTHQQLHTFLTTPESGPLSVKRVCKHLICGKQCENSWKFTKKPPRIEFKQCSSTFFIFFFYLKYEKLGCFHFWPSLL